MKAYTDEELSRILGEHDTGMLVQKGRNWWLYNIPYGCVNQAAYNIATTELAWSKNRDAADIFDQLYNRCMSHEELLQLLR